MAKSLVTGGAGFIGSHIVDALIAAGDSVRVLDDLSTGKKEHLVHLGDQVELQQGDVRDVSAVEQAVKGVDYVFHAAAVRAVLRSVDDPRETNDINVTGTLNVLVASKQAGVKRVVFSSSSSVYGDTEKFPSVETDVPMPESPYAASKIMGEYYCRLYTQLYGLEAVSLRYFNVFGPRQNPESKYSAVIPILVDCLLKKEAPEVHWDGKQSRDFVYVTDVAKANVLARNAPSVAGEAINIGCQEDVSVLYILDQIKQVLNIDGIEPNFKPKRVGDVRRTLADISKAKKLIQYQPSVNCRKGLEETAQWFCAVGT